MKYRGRAFCFAAFALIGGASPAVLAQAEAEDESERGAEGESEVEGAPEVESEPEEDAAAEGGAAAEADEVEPENEPLAEGEERSEDEPEAEPAGEAEESSEDEAEAEPAAEVEAAPIEVDPVTVFGGRGPSKEPGSAHVVDEEDLERFEHNDMHRVLAAVPGVYVREEDGYGLRPNIGMRGATSNRSSKVALLEDGILIAPAPYSAPAAYYTPLITRMQRVEVLKGPVAIQEGPNTVGGAVNFISQSIPRERTVGVDAAGGGDFFGKLHASYGDSGEHFGALVEGVRLQTNGFKELDGGGDTGFRKNDLRLRLRANTSPDARVYHELGVKLGYADETSNETYTGLATADFEQSPYRRYAATQLDEMDWDHQQAHLTYRVDVGGRLEVTTDLYRNQFRRVWDKLDGFESGDSLAGILANPDAGNNAIYYAILRGEEDSFSERLLLGRNDREFVSQGIQSAVRAPFEALGLEHEVSAGARFHMDEVHRDRTEATYTMTDGEMARDETPRQVGRDATASARALALYVQEQASLGPVTATAGVRTEFVGTSWRDHIDPAADSDASYRAIIPGAGVYYQALPSVGVLAGVHKGFLPVAPGQQDDATPEESVNYELGSRFSQGPIAGEVIGFFSDYSNLKGTCSFSQGCDAGDVGDEFDGGAVNIYGLEALVGADLPATDWFRVPLQVSYTLSQSSFRTAFSSTNPRWGEVEVGDELPYLPEHQLAVEVGARAHQWEVALAGRYTSPMRDSAGQGDDGLMTDSSLTIDAAASYTFAPWGTAYATVDNVLDDTSVVSYRPYGARPGKPRLFVIGYKNSF